MPNNTISLQMARQKQESVKIKNRHDDGVNKLRDKHEEEVAKLLKKQKDELNNLDDSFLVTLTSKKDRYSNELYRLEKIHAERVNELKMEQDMEIEKLKTRNDDRIKDMLRGADEVATRMRNEQQEVLKAYQDLKLRRLEENV